MAESEAAPVLLRCLQDNFNKLHFDDEGVSTFTSVEQVSDTDTLISNPNLNYWDSNVFG